jgi:hypothetical protein
MTTTNLDKASVGLTAMDVGRLWREELEHYLHPAHFPARLDQLLATLARHRAPSHLYWRLASLPLSRTFEGLPDLVSSLEAQTSPFVEPEPI